MMKQQFVLCVLSLLMLGSVSSCADDLEARLFYTFMDDRTEWKTAPLRQEGGVHYLNIPKNDIPKNVKYAEIHHPFATATAGDGGFYVFSDGMYGEFKARIDGHYRNSRISMPMFGVKTPKAAMTVIATGMRYYLFQMARVEDNKYTVFPRLELHGDDACDDLKIEFHQLGRDATYADMARTYRQFQLQRKLIRPLRDRVKENPGLKYAAESMEVRVRMGWKPMPTSVEEQNAENEPPMKVAVSFDRFQQIVAEFKKQGVDKAEFCLVGWNIGGHDGRFPQLFPVDERLGGEAKLRAAIKKTQHEGYQIVCHTCNYDIYSVSRIAGLWDDGRDVIRLKDGSMARQKPPLSGGVAYLACPQRMYERFARDDHRKIRDLGFRGAHYIDVFSIITPMACYSPEHPLTKEGYAEWARKIMGDAQSVFGGVASEGGFDHCLPHLDYALYVSIHYDPDKPLPSLVDRHVPFWQLVYSGYILSTPFSRATNYTIKKPFTQLKMIEFAGRPLYYFYSNYREGNRAWMGVEDLRCDTDEELAESVRAVKRGFDEFERLKHLQYETMEGHDQIAENVFKTSFSDGTAIVTNYRATDFDYNGRKVKSMSYIVAGK
ncbi:hypothetical protein M2447_000753 [Ereboglobus sp. PH5-10]|nr:hypothetical protein [Ereboglobus sp. PH5-10]